MLIIPRACARVCVGGRKEPPASRRLGRASPARVASPSREGPRCPRVPATLGSRGRAHAPIPSDFRLCPPPQFPNPDRSSSFAPNNSNFATEQFPFSLLSQGPVKISVKNRMEWSNFQVFFFPRFLSFSKNTFFNRRRIGQFQFGKEKFVVDRNEKVEFHDRQISSVETERKAGGSCRMEFGSDVGGKWFLVAVANGAALPYSSGSLNGPVLVRK